MIGTQKNFFIDGLRLPKIGVGTIGAGTAETATNLSIKKRVDTLSYALERGANLFDTGESYENGFAENIVGCFMKGRREKIILATKFSPQNARGKDLIEAAEKSLRRLQTDYIDIYQMHWPNFEVPFDETFSAIQKLINDGKVRFIGVCNCSISLIDKISKSVSGVRVVTNQIKLNPFKRPTVAEPDYFNQAISRGLINLGYGVFGQGLSKFNCVAKTLILNLAKKYSVNESQILVAWALSFPSTALLLRSMNITHIDQNINASTLVLEKKDVDSLNDCFQIIVQEIPVLQINVKNSDADDAHIIYSTLDEALRNKAQLYPDVESISKEITALNYFEPVEVIKIGDKYELVQGRMRYWAWRYRNGDGCTIPAIVISN